MKIEITDEMVDRARPFAGSLHSLDIWDLLDAALNPVEEEIEVSESMISIGADYLRETCNTEWGQRAAGVYAAMERQRRKEMPAPGGQAPTAAGERTLPRLHARKGDTSSLGFHRRRTDDDDRDLIPHRRSTDPK